MANVLRIALCIDSTPKYSEFLKVALHQLMQLYPIQAFSM